MPEIDLTGLDQVQAGNRELLSVGEYRLQIQEATEKLSNKGKRQLDVKLAVMNGPVQTDGSDPTARETHDFIPLEPVEALFRVKNLMVAAGIITKDDKATKKLQSDLLIGAEVRAKITARMYTDPATKEVKEQRDIQYLF